MVMKEFLENDVGSGIVSIILGIGLAALFQKACKDNNCIIIKGPAYKDIKDKIYIHDGKCYTYKPESASCPSKKTI
jgi:hypothetical protein